MRTGILLPESILEEPWFLAFTLFVAFNTIIYLGLTLAKVVPWPGQIHPRQVRAFLPGPWLTDGSARRLVEGEMTVTQAKEKGVELGSDPFAYARAESARATVPLGLAFLGALVVIFALVNALLSPINQDLSRLVSVVFGLLMLILAQRLDRRGVKTRTMTLVMAIVTVLFTAKLSWDAVALDSPVTLTYCIVVITIMPAITLSWRVAIPSGLIQWLIIVWAGFQIEAVDTLLWAIAALSGLLAGWTVLRLRLNNIDRITLEELRRNTSATLDPLTGLLSRQGLTSVANSIDRAIESPDDARYIVEIDIADMTGINARYGLEYGDSVIDRTAQVLRSQCTEGQQAARWDGDRFLILGFGEAPKSGPLIHQIEAALADSGIALGKSPITFHARVVSGPKTTFQQLLVDLSQLSSAPSKTQSSDTPRD